ncbi:MAG: pyruvate-formate lyase-activating enzyme, partial [Bacillota bacterium]|nr:pyruvate-formate lyase-activating enzyme [Bacillota bacterium]
LRQQGNIGVAYTYNEPAIWYEYVYDTAKLVRENGMLNVIVTNGFIGSEALDKLLPLTDAMNIDLKAYREDLYEDFLKGGLREVKASIKQAAASCHVEVTMLVIPEFNDSVSEMEEMAEWLASLSPELPLHLSRYFPRYELTDREPTPYETLSNLKKAAERHLKYVYLGNV